MNATADRPRTMFDKIWDAHVVAEHPKRPAVLYVDLHLVHEVTSPQAFSTLRERSMKVRRPDRTLATMDHSTPTKPGGLAVVDSEADVAGGGGGDACEQPTTATSSTAGAAPRPAGRRR